MPNEMGLTIKIPKDKHDHKDKNSIESEDCENKPMINTNKSILSSIFKILSRIKNCFIK